MGLHQTAHYLKTKGRAGDTELVHMTKGEVKGLQALALAHGGSLTINPDTGLPEANFLKRALPTIAGVAVGAMTMNPMLGSAVAGGLTMATGGSLIQGLMAGVGAYGGAGMMSGLAEAGATQMAAETASQAVQSQAVSQGMGQAFQTAGAEQLLAAPEGNLLLPGGSAQNAVNIGANIPETFAPITSGAPAMPTFSSATQAAEALKSGAISADQYANFAQNYAQNVPAATGADTMTMANLQRGFGMGPQGFSPTNLATNVYDLVKKDPTQAAMAAAPLLTNMDTEERGAPGPSGGSYASSISPNFRAYVPDQPNPYYREQYPDYRRRAAQGGIMNSFDDENGSDMARGGTASSGGYANGGQINLQGTVNLDQNSMGNSDNMMRPQPHVVPQGGYGMGPQGQQGSPQLIKDIGPGGLSNQISPGGPGGIGAAQLAVMPRNYEPLRAMASGGMVAFANTGAVRLSKGDPGIYRDPDPSTRGLSALEAEIAQRKKLMGRFGIPMAEMPKTGIKSLGGNFSDVAAAGGTASLGGYSDGGRMLKGPGDGMSDSIPASIANKQPARLADGEFVVPADVVSHLGNGSTDAGARKLYSMMDKIRKARTGKKRQAPAVKADRYVPA